MGAPGFPGDDTGDGAHRHTESGLLRKTPGVLRGYVASTCVTFCNAPNDPPTWRFPPRFGQEERGSQRYREPRPLASFVLGQGGANRSLADQSSETPRCGRR